MKISKYEGTVERTVVAHAIMLDTVCAAIAAKWGSSEDALNSGLFNSKWSNMIVGWCVDHYNRYGKAPKKDIGTIFRVWAQKTKEEKTRNLIENFLESLSETFHKMGSKYVLDKANELFNQVQMQRTIDQVQTALDGDNPKLAMQVMAKWDKLDLSQQGFVNVLKDASAIEIAMTETLDPVIEYDGALEIFYKDQLVRDGFISLLAPEKRGKTWWLLDFAWRAMEQGRNVAMFQLGDLSQNQVMRRFLTRAAKRPLRIRDWETEPVKVPNHIERTGEGVIVEYEEFMWENDLKVEKAIKAMKRANVNNLDGLRLSTHPAKTVSVPQISAILRSSIRQGWHPDVVVLDYADLIAPSRPGLEGRDAINDSWARLRGMSQEFNCLVLTATQSDAAGYNSPVLSMDNFSEDKRKFAHVTGMIGINQTQEEKQRQIQRLNWILLREDDYVQGKCVTVAGCFKIANPATVSIY